MIDLCNLRCPCFRKKKLKFFQKKLHCINLDCLYSKRNNFKIRKRLPILVNFKMPLVVFKEKNIQIKFRIKDFSIFKKLKNNFLKVVYGISDVTMKNTDHFLKIINSKKYKELNVLVIGGASKGQGTEKLWSQKNIKITSIDIMGTDNTNYIADAHYLPFKKNLFDGVFIQAVLEHVLSPEKVVAEIYRVLKYDGIVYAETPFMQQIHMGCNDYTRYTVSGHRYLFKRFKNKKSGINGGSGISLAWSIKYYCWSLFGERLSNYLSIIPFLILRLLDRFIPINRSWDSASGVYFLGIKKKNYTFNLLELSNFYKGRQK